MIRRPSLEAWRAATGLIVALVLVTGCDVLFPYGAAPGPRDLPDDRPVAVDVRNDRAADAPTIDGAEPRTDVRRDLVDASLTPWPDGRACATWAAWNCPSFAWYYCKAFCGSMKIECSTVSCTCAAGGSTKTCTNTSPAYCKGCQDALASGCCQ